MSGTDLRASFDATVDEYVDVGMRHALFNPAHQTTRRQSRIRTTFLLMVVAAVVLYNGRGDVTAAQWLAFAAAIGAAGAGFFALHDTMFDWRMRASYRRRMAETFGDASRVNCEFEVRDAGLWMRSGLQEFSVNWSGVLGVEADAGDVVIVLDPGLAIVRRRAFASVERRDAFVSAINARRRPAAPDVSTSA